MENNYFITDEPDKLVANLRTIITPMGKVGDWKNGYGKYTVAIILLYVGNDVYETGFPKITFDNFFGLLFFYGRIVFVLSIVYNIYKGSFKSNRDLLVINRKGILYNEEIFWWSDLVSFQVSLEMEMRKQNYVYYLHLRTKNNIDHKINLSMYDKKFDEIHSAMLKNMGKHEVTDLGFTQIL